MYERVSQGRRIVGFTLDWLASYAIALGLFGGAGDLASKLDRSRGLTILIVALEYFLLVAMTGASFGHRLVGLKVIQFTDGSKPTFMQALVRTALLVVVITAITFDENGRGINERLSHTALVKTH
jgi:hypothetical protein